VTFSGRRRRNVGITVVLAALLIAFQGAYDATLWRGEFLSGWLLLGAVVLLAFYSARKKLPVLPVGSSAAWLQVHIYLGWLSVVLFLLHVRWGLPGGRFEGLLGTVFALVAASGVIGAFLSGTLAKRLTRRGEEVILERIPIFIEELRTEVEKTALQAAQETESSSISDFYDKNLREFFRAPRNMGQHLIASNRASFAIFRELDNIGRYLDPREQEYAEHLRDLIRKKDDLDFHYALQTTLKSWLFVHVPLTYGLLILALLHLVLVYAFGGGVA
jgi:hypothetical protein